MISLLQHFIFALFVVFLCSGCCSNDFIDETITTGTLDGFVIGSNSEDVYLQIQLIHKSSGFESYFLWPNFDRRIEIHDFSSKYRLWNHWHIGVTFSVDSVIMYTIDFNENKVKSLDLLKRIHGTLSENYDNRFQIGQSIDSVYEIFKELLSDSTIIESSIYLDKKNFNMPYDPAMADISNYSRYSDSTLAWILIYDKDGSGDDLTLYLRNNQLIRIQRYRAVSCILSL